MRKTVKYIIAKEQTSLNQKICTEGDWEKIRTKKQMKLNCITEMGEVFGCLPECRYWKPYDEKKYIAKLKMELIDVLHFSMSGVMLSRELSSIPDYIPLISIDDNTYSIIMDDANKGSFLTLTYHISDMSKLLNFDLLAFYLAKATLNRIRQLKGYKTGSYQKTINGIEDNDIILQLIPVNLKNKGLDDFIDDKEIFIYENMISNIYDKFSILPKDRSNVFKY